MVKEEIILESKIVDYTTGTTKKIVKSLQTIRNKAIETTKVYKQLKNSQLQTGVKTVVKNISASTKALRENNNFIRKTRKTYNSFGKVMAMPLDQWQRFNKTQSKFATLGARTANRIRMMTHGLKGFNMAMLGIMFFGMAMKRMFTGWLKPAMQMTGIFDLFRTTLGVLFLPVALQLLKILIPIFKWIMDLSPATKKIIGWIVILGAVIGGVLFIVGQFALGIGAIIMVFSSLFGIIDRIIPDVSVFGVNVSSAVEALIGVAIPITLWKGLSKVFDTVLDSIFEMKSVKKLLKDWGIAIDETKTGTENLKEIWGKLIDKVKEKIKDTPLGDAIEKIKDELGINGEGSILSQVFENAKKIFDDVMKDLNKQLDEWGVNDAIEEMKSLGKTMEDIVPSIETIAKAIQAVATAINAVVKGFKLMGSFFKGFLSPNGVGLPSLSLSKGVSSVMEEMNKLPSIEPIDYSDVKIPSTSQWAEGLSGDIIDKNVPNISSIFTSPLPQTSTVNLTSNYNVSVSNANEIYRVLEDHDNDLMDKITRNI